MRLNIRDISYHVEVKGEGFPLVLLHGFTGDLQHGTLSLSNGVRNGHVFALISSVMERLIHQKILTDTRSNPL